MNINTLFCSKSPRVNLALISPCTYLDTSDQSFIH